MLAFDGLTVERNQEKTMTTDKTASPAILRLLEWTAPINGIRRASAGANTQRFWAEWRENKEALRAAGVRVKPGTSRNWEITWTTGETVDTASRIPEQTEPAPAPSAAVEPKKLDLTVGSIEWSEEQVAIIKWFSQTKTGNLIVAALAGTGKTFTITHGFKYAPEQDIAYLVFNAKNRKEAEAKITDPRVDIMTLNACGKRCIGSVWRGSQPDDNVEFDRIERAFPNIPEEAATATNRLVAFAKNTFIGLPTVDQLTQLAIDRDINCGLQDDDEKDAFPESKLAEIALAAMKLAMEKDPANRHSFNDQVWLSVAMNWVRPSYDLVVVDETQDMNMPQLAMVRRLVRKTGRCAVVGDQNQAIYGFRGAAQNGMDLMRDALNATTLPLTITRRCPKAVVQLAAQIVPTYRAADDAPEGELMSCNEVELMSRVKIGDAILSRANAPLMSICLQLLKRGTPARIEGRDIGKQLAGMVSKMKARSVPDFLRRLSRWEDKQLKRIKDTRGYEAKAAAIRDMADTLEAVAEGCASVDEIVLRIKSMFVNSDDASAKPAVVLSSVHKAKGLEWDNTFLLDWTFGARKAKTPAEEQEEKNIRYVALTRSKRTLTRVCEGGSPEVKENADGTKEVEA